MRNVLKRNQIMITALAIMIAVAGYLNFAGTQVGEEQLTTAGAVNEEENMTALLDLSEEDIASDIESMDSDQDSVAVADYLESEMTLDGLSLENAQVTVIGDSVESEQAAGTAVSGEQTAAESGSSVQTAAGEATIGEQVTASSSSVEGIQLAEADQTDADVPDGEVPGEAVFTSSSGVSSLAGAKLQKEQVRAKNKETLLDIINSSAISDEQKQDAINGMINLTDMAEKETAAEILLEAKGFSDVVVSISGTQVDVVVNSSSLTDAQRAQIEDIVTRKTGISPENIIISPVTGN